MPLPNRDRTRGPRTGPIRKVIASAGNRRIVGRRPNEFVKGAEPTMTRGERPGLGYCVAVLLGLLAPVASAQMNQTNGPPPLLIGLSPPAIAVGTSAEWTVRGQNLDGV